MEASQPIVKSGCLPVDVCWPMRRKPLAGPDYRSYLVWEHRGIHQEELEEVSREKTGAILISLVHCNPDLNKQLDMTG